MTRLSTTGTRTCWVCTGLTQFPCSRKSRGGARWVRVVRGGGGEVGGGGNKNKLPSSG